MKYYKVATAGTTADGREIKPEWLHQIAETYDKTKYAARIWIEHLRGASPSSEFRAVGCVEAVKVEIEGDKTCLYAAITPTEDLKKITQSGNKISPSIEIDPNFAGSGKAYLYGLGVTDSPASLYTDVLRFSAASNFSAPIMGASNQTFTQTADWSAEDFGQDGGQDGQGSGLVEKITLALQSAFDKFRTKSDDGAGQSEAIAQAQAGAIAAAVASELIAFKTQIAADNDAKFAQFELKITQAIDSEQQALSNNGAPGRPPATGGGSDYIAADY